LEVGSAGIGQPFKVLQQYINHIDKDVEVLALDGKKYRGVLTSANEEGIVVTVPVKEKPEGAKRPVLVNKEFAWKYNEIKYTKYLINF
jgi:ribosome maturation factor RimP